MQNYVQPRLGDETLGINMGSFLQWEKGSKGYIYTDQRLVS